MSTLYLVSTPIGNIEDITIRALKTLWSVDAIFCEDTREIQKLLTHFKEYQNESKHRLISLNQINESGRVSEVIEHLKKGEDVALVSDRGTPLISDPGYLVVRSVIALIKSGEEFIVEALPGANALLPALQLSGFPASRFLFVGFLSKKGTDRKKELSVLPHETVVMYESPRRLLETLTLLGELGEGKIAVCRELTKVNEEVFRGSFNQALTHFTAHPPLGEVTLVFRR